MKEENGAKSQRRKGRHRDTDSQFVKRWMVTLACGCACVILSMSLMLSVWKNRQLTQQAQFVEAQRFNVALQRGKGVHNVHNRAFSKFQELHHHVIRNGERYPGVVKYKDQDAINNSDDDDVNENGSDDKRADATSKEGRGSRRRSDEDNTKSISEHESQQESVEELKEKVRKLRDVYNAKVTKHRQRRAAGEPISPQDESALMQELKEMRVEYYKMINQVKHMRGNQSQPGVSTRQDRSERHRQAQRIQEEKYASKQLRDNFLKGEHRMIREAAARDDYPRADEIRP